MSRRKWDVLWLTIGLVVIGATATIAALAGDTERIGNYWTHAAVSADGLAQIDEVIDYDFGPRQRHGILRDIPGAKPNAEFVVDSPTAPNEVQITSSISEVKLRIGDPDSTISGRHRYHLSYPLETLVQGERIAWNTVGTGWDHPLNNVEAHLTTNRDIVDLTCHRGRRGDVGGCDVVKIAPRHLLVTAEGVDAGEAITIEATLVGAVSVLPPAPVMPVGAAVDPGTGWYVPLLSALAAALVAIVATSRRIRKLGREQVWVGGAADAAFGGVGGEVFGHRLLDQEELAEMATIEFAPPTDVSAAAGGIIYSESVQPEHQVAWLIECAIREEVVIDDTGEDIMLSRGPAEPHPVVASRLNSFFAASDHIRLGTFDEEFARSWVGLTTELNEWRKKSDLWDPAGGARRTKALLFGSMGVVAGLGLTVLGAIASNRAGTQWLWLCFVGAAAAGAGVAAMVRSWELHVRTPKGSGIWLLVESFRRFIAGSEAQHAEAAARMGLLRQYTAWAVALGELDHWHEAVEQAGSISGTDYRFLTMSSGLSAATTQTFTSPSSSGGGGGGGAGGGGGGGGGGSW